MDLSTMRRTHVRQPCHVEVGRIAPDGTFTLTFYDSGGDGKAVVVHLRPWWVSYIAEELWKVVDQQEKETAQIRAALRRG